LKSIPIWNDVDLDSPKVDDKAGFISKGHLKDDEDASAKTLVVKRIRADKMDRLVT
jgi:hypothetical protein